MLKKIYSDQPLDNDKCVEQIGNRFDLILVASARARELRRGHHKMVSTTNSVPVTALREIEEGHIGRDYLKRIR